MIFIETSFFTQDVKELLDSAEGHPPENQRGLELVDTRLFKRLASSMREMDQISRGERLPAREFEISAVDVQEIRKATGLSQANFARIIHVQLGTLKNWEQGRRDPTGPAKALLQVIRKDPVRVLKALSEGG